VTFAWVEACAELVHAVLALVAAAGAAGLRLLCWRVLHVLSGYVMMRRVSVDSYLTTLFWSVLGRYVKYLHISLHCEEFMYQS
jgi:hypothetical protein